MSDRKIQLPKIKFLDLIKSRFANFYLRAMTHPFQTALVFILLTWIGVGYIEYKIEDGLKPEGYNIKSAEDGIWWGIVTLLTIGYGDRFPVSTEGRILAGFLMISGVVGIAVVTAKISSFFLERALMERSGFVDTNLLRNHFVICGWKTEMPSFLTSILDANRGMDPGTIVLINNAPIAEIENLLQVPRLKKVKVIHADFYIELNLKRAAPERASKILILADATPDQAGNIPTLTEADARTIMTAMTLNNIAKGTPVVAEILDPSMDQYLRLAHVNEIVYSRDYSRLLLALSSASVGVTNIFHDLLSPHSPYFISTREIPENMFLQTYDKLYSYFRESRPKEVLIGVLENSGNSHVAKEIAIRKAQQTPNIAQLVQNLQGVKSLRFNQPKFGPSRDYVIKDGSMAIVIEDRAVANV